MLYLHTRISTKTVFYLKKIIFQDQVTVTGRISCDSVGKLNAKSVILEGSRESSAGKCIPLDLSSLKEYSLFPGQLVAMIGTNATGQKFVVSKTYEVFSDRKSL